MPSRADGRPQWRNRRPRTAVRLLASHGEPAAEALLLAFGSNDSQVRRAALRALCLLKSGDAMTVLASATDATAPAPAGRSAAGRLPPRDGRRLQRERPPRTPIGESAESPQNATWPFSGHPSSGTADWDHDVKTIQKIAPKEDWAIMTNPTTAHQELVRRRLQAPTETHPIEDHWEKAGISTTATPGTANPSPPRKTGRSTPPNSLRGGRRMRLGLAQRRLYGQHNLGPSGWTPPSPRCDQGNRLGKRQPTDRPSPRFQRRRRHLEAGPPGNPGVNPPSPLTPLQWPALTAPDGPYRRAGAACV